ncbi:MAG: hypothetical protein QOH63_174 [Acidobacteriota bacterium]|jgi:hypothetical protein|nr:hypothetical protein [Acidobacteriota bacterium]
MTTKKSTKKAHTSKIGRSDKETCFTIMPFGGWFDEYYVTIYRPAIESAGLTPCRADDLYRPSTIINDIWSYTKNSRLILADLTGKNPNVFYELGLAHALAKPAIIVAESMDDVPFDLRALRVIEYNKNAPDWGGILREKIQSSISEIIESPLESVLPAFLDVRPQTTKPTVTPHEKEVLELKQDLDVVRRELRAINDRGTRSLKGIPFQETEMSTKGFINPREARRRIRDYLELGLSDDEIVERLSAGFVPEKWTRDKIEEVKSESKAES